jgi:hypothetical protein
MTDKLVGKKWDVIRYIDELDREYRDMLLHTTAYVCPGWMKLIKDMLEEIQQEVGSDMAADEQPVFTTIKEKFGTLRVYGYNISDTEQAILDKYAALSSETCMTCGAFGQMREKGGWLYVACDEHEQVMR